MSKELQYRDAIRFHHMETTGTGISRGGVGRLLRVTINDPNASAALTVWESSGTSGEKIAVIDCATAGTYEYGVTVSGLTVSLGGGNADLTVIYQ